MYFSSSTLQLLDSLRRELPQSLLLSGDPGVALEPAMRYIVSSSAFVVEPDDSKTAPTISVETIRSLYDQTKSRYADKRVVVITQADTMTASAQAAFLKLLEEPGNNVHFILLSYAPTRLLPTIRSRVQAHVIERLSDEKSREFIATKGVTDPQKVTQLLYLASGLPLELEHLIEDEAYFASSAALIKDAQVLLSTDPYQKLVLAHRYKDDRAAALRLVNSGLLLARKSISTHPDYQIVKRLERLQALHQAIAANHNIRLAFAHFVL